MDTKAIRDLAIAKHEKTRSLWTDHKMAAEPHPIVDDATRFECSCGEVVAVSGHEAETAFGKSSDAPLMIIDCPFPPGKEVDAGRSLVKAIEDYCAQTGIGFPWLTRDRVTAGVR